MVVDVSPCSPAPIGVLYLTCRGPGVGDIVGGHRRAVAPLGSGLELEGELGARIVPRIGAVCQQRILLAVEHVVQVRRLEHDDAGIVLLRDGHRIVVAVGVRIPADHRTPLLTVEVERLIAGQRIGIGRRSRPPPGSSGLFSRRRGRLFGGRCSGFGLGGRRSRATTCRQHHAGDHQQRDQNRKTTFHICLLKGIDMEFGRKANEYGEFGCTRYA